MLALPAFKRRDPIDLTTFIDGPAVEAVHRKAWRLSRQWAKAHWPEARSGGIDLHEVLRNQMFLPFTAALNAEAIWRRVIEAVRPSRVVMFEPAGMPVHMLQHFETDVPAAVLAFVSEQAGIELAWLARPAELAPRTSVEGARPAAAPGWLGRSSPGRTVLAMGGGRDHRDQRRLVESLADSEGIAVCHVDVGRADALYGAPPGPPWQALLSLVDVPEALSSAIEDGWRRFRDARDRHDAEPAVLFANRHLAFQFQYYRDKLLEVSRVIAATRLALDVHQPCGLLLSNDNDVLRGAVYAARQRGIPSVELVHGGIAYFQVYDFATDAMIVWGRTQADELARFGRPADRIFRGGNYNDAVPVIDAGTVDARRRRLLDDIGMPRANRVVVLVTAQPNNELTVLRTNLTRHQMAWEALARYARRRRDVAFVIKPHPVHDDPLFYAGLVSDGAPFRILDGRRKLLDLLPLCDAAVLVSAPSTAALEAMLCGKPVAYLRSACFAVDGYQTALDREGAVVIDDLGRLEAVLDAVIDDTPERRAAIDAARAFVDRFVDATGEAALSATAGLVLGQVARGLTAANGSAAWRAAMAAAVGDYLASGEAAVFGRRMTAAAAAWPERVPNPDRLAGLLVGWVVASRHRPPGADLPRRVAAVFAALPEPLRLGTGIRRRWMARLHAVLAFDAARAGHPRHALRHRWAARGWRVGARIGARPRPAGRAARAEGVSPCGDGGVPMTEAPR